jgi:hypothetical protein
MPQAWLWVLMSRLQTAAKHQENWRISGLVLLERM